MCAGSNGITENNFLCMLPVACLNSININLAKGYFLCQIIYVAFAANKQPQCLNILTLPELLLKKKIIN